MRFTLVFAKNLAIFVLGFLAVIGMLNILAWMFGNTVAIIIAWIIVILGWVGIVTARQVAK